MKSVCCACNARLAVYKLLIVDELGYVPLSPTGAQLLFEVFSQRYERGGMADLPHLRHYPTPGDQVFESRRTSGRVSAR
jgi:DNA replication protein DnaC